MTGYKECVYIDKKNDGYQILVCIVELEIPEDAIVVRPLIADRFTTRESNKLRCDRAFVKAIFSYDKSGDHNRLPDDTIAYSITSLNYCVNRFRTEYLMEAFENTFKYIVGETVTPEHDLDINVNRECGTSGIHFFETFEEANKYKGLLMYILVIKDTFAHFNETNRKD